MLKNDIQIKKIKIVKSGAVSTSIKGFLFGTGLAFQRGKAKTLKTIYHFTFTGSEEVKATIKIWEGKLLVEEGQIGRPDLRVLADAKAWLRFLNQEISLLRMLITRKLKIKGNPRLLADFGKCFPS